MSTRRVLVLVPLALAALLLRERIEESRRAGDVALMGPVDPLADPDAAYEISKNYVEGLDGSRRDVLEASLDFWRADTLGQTDADSWDRTQTLLIEMGLLDGPVAGLDQAYTNDFIQKVQP